MIRPRVPSGYFFKLDSVGQTCFKHGMPIGYCRDASDNFTFKAEKLSEGKNLSAVEQEKIFSAFKTSIPEEPQVTIFSSSGTDHLALTAVSQLLRGHVRAGWTDFEFVSQNEDLPQDLEDTKGLYCLMGIHQDDQVQWVRKWVRSRLGTSIWICTTTDKPVDWFRTKLGIKPDFLFSIKGAGRSAG